MATSQTISSSSCLSNSPSKSADDALESGKLSSKNNHLVICGSQLSWKGDIEGLKDFTRNVLKMTGRWKSPGGEVKAFYSSHEELIFKWQGLKRKKIEIVKDRNNELLKNLKSHACDENEVNNGKIFNDHVLYEAMSLPLPSRTCGKCGVDESHPDHTEMECKLKEVLSRLSKLEEKTINEKKAESVLIESNKIMAAEIESLKATVAELREENDSIKNLLDIKQSEWIETESKRKTSKPKAAATPITSVVNRFDTLAVEDSSDERTLGCQTDEATNIGRQIESYRAKQKRDFQKLKKTRQNEKARQNCLKESEKKTLVIGDSMIKHIEATKIQRAARSKTVCHSYSGATVGQLQEKFEDNCQNDEYKTVIIHVGTNDLVHEDENHVAEKMENLIEKVRQQTERIAVSSVIRRYDSKVSQSKIASYNNLLHNLCLKHNIYYINNDNIDKPLLNRSNLHLNKVGDKALGSAFCTFLKSIRASHAGPVPPGSGEPFFPPAVRRTKEWTDYLRCVRQAMRN